MIETKLIKNDLNNQLTITTACNKKFIWGAYLLIASLRSQRIKLPINVIVSGFDESDIALLEQFENVTVIPTKTNRLLLQKPEAIFSAKTEYIAWIDADCITYGDISKYLIAPDETFQIRFRDSNENTYVFSDKYNKDDQDGKFPKHIIKQWQKDVGERDIPRYTTQCTTNCFILHRKYLPFIEKWKVFINNFIPDSESYVDKKNRAYFMTDESILTALFAFSHEAPIVQEYLLDKDVNNYLVHFGMRRKPWNRWQKKHFQYYDLVIDICQWALDHGYKTPPIPWTMKKSFKWLAWLDANTDNILNHIKNFMKKLI